MGRQSAEPEIESEILQQELDSVEENLEVLYQQGAEVSNAQIKGMEKRKMNLEARLKDSRVWAGIYSPVGTAHLIPLRKAGRSYTCIR